MIDGHKMFARPFSEPNIWQSGADRSGLTSDAGLQARQARAMEQVSGCKIIPGTSSMLNGFLVAAVDCP